MATTRLLPQTEADFQAQIVQLARILGWETMHVRRTIGRGKRWTTSTSKTGWPDLAIWRLGRFMLVEVKTNHGSLTPEQDQVLTSLGQAGVEVHVWRPHMWTHIEATLKGTK